MSQKPLKNANWIQLAFFFLICTHKLTFVNLLVNISCKNMRSKWTVFKQMMHTSFQNHLSIFLPTYPYIEIGTREWNAENFSWSDLPLSMQNQQTLSLWGKRDKFLRFENIIEAAAPQLFWVAFLRTACNCNIVYGGWLATAWLWEGNK